MHTDTRPTVDVIRDVVDDAQDLIRKEVELAKLEVTEAVSEALRAAAFGAAGAVLALFTLGFAGAAAAFALSEVLPPWGAWLAVTAVFGLLAGAAAIAGRARARNVELTPTRTKRSIEEDVRWARQRLTH